MPQAIRAVLSEIWQPTEAKKLRLHEIVQAWRVMTQPTYAERRSVVPDLSSAYARNRFKSKGKDHPVYLAHYDLKIKGTANRHCKTWVRIPYKPRNPI